MFVSAFGAKSFDLAVRIGDGFITTQPDAERVAAWKVKAGRGKPAQGGYKVCVAPTEDEGVAIAHRLWANAGLPGELSQVLPSPTHFEQASELVTEQMTRESTVCGSDVDTHVERVRTVRRGWVRRRLRRQHGTSLPRVLHAVRR